VQNYVTLRNITITLHFVIYVFIIRVSNLAKLTRGCH